ncbi:MAG: hypothetical protein Q8P56_02790 [Candidatus Uhrbacteria bacterium]|nr:hypothetical protein [Candidatus Uhrbacteria bacterium]
MKKIVVLSLILLTGFVAFVYTKKMFTNDYGSSSNTLGITRSSDDELSDAALNGSTGIENFNYSYPDGGTINGAKLDDSTGSTLFKSKVDGGLIDGTIGGSGDMNLE